METTIETNNSDEINVLRIKLEVVEKELQLAISRAEKAENDLEQIKSLYKTNSSNRNTSIATTTISSNEPPTVCCLICNSTIEPKASTSSLTSITTSPPPPPPMPNFKLPTVNFTKSSIVSLSDGIEAFALNNMRQVDTDENSLSKKPATGRLSAYTHLYSLMSVYKVYCSLLFVFCFLCFTCFVYIYFFYNTSFVLCAIFPIVDAVIIESFRNFALR